MKRCTDCNKEKPLSDFYKDSSRNDGYRIYCKECDVGRAKEYYKENRDRVLDKYNPSEPMEDICDNPNCDNKYERYQPPERHRFCSTKCQKHTKYYYEGGKERALQRERMRSKTNPQFRLYRNMRSSIYQSLIDKKNGRRWEDLVGYTLSELKEHLEKNFEDGMSWDNYGEWHIDHIIPQSAFNYTKPSHLDFKRCWALDNLQPMWAEQNLSKNNSIDDPFQPSLQL